MVVTQLLFLYLISNLPQTQCNCCFYNNNFIINSNPNKEKQTMKYICDFSNGLRVTKTHDSTLSQLIVLIAVEVANMLVLPFTAADDAACDKNS